MFGFNNKELKEYNYSKEILEGFKYAKITTKNGIIWIKLYNKETPNTVSNFASLSNNGFYNNLTFHRVIPNFMAQGGCPNGDGTGGTQWAIACETQGEKQNHTRGKISMAHAGPNTGGSQFFICFEDSFHLDKVHTVFGEIENDDENSFKVLDKIKQDDKIISIEIKKSK